LSSTPAKNKESSRRDALNYNKPWYEEATSMFMVVAMQKKRALQVIFKK
jgi:hypothetical protein